ncbi:MAG: phosphohistidine phosphatase SixA [Pseudomonadota bacterium]|jgi:phosphohistidine phosphatase
MDLIFWRHAETTEALDGQADAERPLTARGERQALRMAHWLERQLPESTKILCCPSVRAEQTVIPLGRKYKLREELSPNASIDDVLTLAQWPLNKNSILLVTHQPLIGEIISQLMQIQLQELVVRKGSVWWLRSRFKDEKPQTMLVTVQTPELL